MRMLTCSIVASAAVILGGCCNCPKDEHENGNGGPSEPQTVTFRKTVDDAPGMGREHHVQQSFEISLGRTFDPDAITGIVIWIDTGGLSYHMDACDRGVEDSCDDGLEIIEVKRWDRATGSGASNSAVDEIDSGEQQYFDENRNANYFEAARDAVADGEFEVAVHPYAEDDYELKQVAVTITYREAN